MKYPLLFNYYQKMPDLLKSIITRIVFRPKLGTGVKTFGNIVYGPNATIGDYTYIHKDSYIAFAMIGKFCSIGKCFSIITGKRNYKLFSTYPFIEMNVPFKSYDGMLGVGLPVKDVEIGNDVWIGEGVSILPGLTIGNGAIIGANSLVTKDVPPYAIGGGVPFRVIKYRFKDETIQKLQESKWWDYSLSQLSDEYKNLSKIVENG